MAFVIYGMSVFGGFIQDDLKVIVSDPDMGKVSALAAAFMRPYYFMDSGDAGLYRPVTSVSFYLNALILGKGAWGFHLVNVILYAVVCLLVFSLLKRLVSGKEAFWLAVVFAVLPIHTEAVNNIVGRAEILSMIFLLLAIDFQEKRRWEYGAFLFLLALLSKETAIVGLPVLIYLLVISKEDKDAKKGVTIFYLLVTGLFLLLRLVILGPSLRTNATIVENPLKFLGTSQRVMNAFALVPFGLGKIIFPWHLSYDYSFNQLKLVTSWLDGPVILGIVMALGSAGSLWTRLRKNKRWILGQAFFWGPLVITGNFLFPVGTIFGERLWFWPSLGIIILLSSCRLHTFWARRNIFPAGKFSGTQCLWSTSSGHHAAGTLHNPVQKGVGYVALIMIMILFALRTGVRNVDWLSQERLFLHDAEYAKDSVLVQSNAAAMYLMKGEWETGKKYMDKADEIYPKYPELLNNWGMYYLWKGNKEEAKNKFTECLRERPEYVLCVENMKLADGLE